MESFFCPRHTETKLRFVLRGGVGYCERCFLYTRAAGLPEPTREAPKVASKLRKAKAKKRAIMYGSMINQSELVRSGIDGAGNSLMSKSSK